jgi:hypothetical protein
MREIRQSGSEGGGAGNSTGSPYPYYACAPSGLISIRKASEESGDVCKRLA